MRNVSIYMCTALLVVLFLAGGVSFAYTSFIDVPPNTEPYSTEEYPLQPPPAPQGDVTFYTVFSDRGRPSSPKLGRIPEDSWGLERTQMMRFDSHAFRRSTTSE